MLRYLWCCFLYYLSAMLLGFEFNVLLEYCNCNVMWFNDLYFYIWFSGAYEWKIVWFMLIRVLICIAFGAAEIIEILAINYKAF